LGGTGAHKVYDVLARGGDLYGFDVGTDRNTLTACTATDNDSLGFSIEGSNNKIVSSSSYGNNPGGVGSGFTTQGGKNKFVKCFASGNTAGFVLAKAEGNQFKECVAFNNDSFGFVELNAGGSSKFFKNRAFANGGPGFEIISSDNMLKGNVATGNTSQGLFLRSAASGNRVDDNHATDNATDLQDDSCTNNAWRNSSFVTSSGQCIQ
jgi:parallel beta-helix repeat protein